MAVQRNLFDKDTLDDSSVPSTSEDAALPNSGGPAAGVAAPPHDARQPIVHPIACPPGAADDAPTPQQDVLPATEDRLEGKVVYLVDSHSLIFQVFHALPEMSSPQGEPVGAVFGFVRDMLFLHEDKKPDYLFCAFDLPGPTFRHTLYENYKVDREEMPESLRPQIARIRDVLEVLGIPVLCLEGYEADDVLATVARLVDERGGTCYLVTGDKDCRQLITDHVFLYNIRKNEVFDAQALQASWGIRPDQVVDFQSIVGDPVDNVPGVPGIGPKGAQQLLEEFGSLDEVLSNIDKISGKKKQEGLREHGQLAQLSRQLVKLVADLPIDVPWAAGRPGRIDYARAAELFRELGFRTITEKMESHLGQSRAEWKTNYRTVATEEELRQLVSTLQQAKYISVDTETTSVQPREAKIVGYSFGWGAGEAVYVPVRAPRGEPQIDPDKAVELLRPVLEDPHIPKVGQNLKYDVIVLRAAGIQLKGITFDTMIASYLLEAGARNHNLDELARRYLQHDNIKISSLIGSGKKQITMDQVSVPLITDYAAEDADVPWRLVELLSPQLDQQGLRTLFSDIEVPLIDVLAEMEFNGIRVSTERLADLRDDYQQRLDQLELEIYALAGHQFNIASPKQLATVLFDELKLQVIKKTKTGASTDAEVLEQLAEQHPLPAKIIEYRQFAKLIGTYIEALPKLIFPETGRIHTSFNQVVAATGRLSSMEPNLQNIPVRTREGREIRSAFLPGADDWLLLTADYSQIELRVLASFSHDPTLVAAFAAGEDIHARVASEVNGVPLESVTSEMRRQAKAVNFGVIYGQSPFGLAKSIGIDQEAAAEFIDAYFGRYSGIERFMNDVLDGCRKNGYVSTILGRRRLVSGVRSAEQRGTSRMRTLPERTAINTVIQGSAADLIKLAMLQVHQRLRELPFPARLLLQIHDELVFEVPAPHVESLADIVRHEMESIGHLDVPLRVDVKSGANWAECEVMDRPATDESLSTS
jgi:DNA polymerase-1